MSPEDRLKLIRDITSGDEPDDVEFLQEQLAAALEKVAAAETSAQHLRGKLVEANTGLAKQDRTIKNLEDDLNRATVEAAKGLEIIAKRDRKIKDLEERLTSIVLWPPKLDRAALGLIQMKDGDFLGRHTLKEQPNPLPVFTKNPDSLRPGMPVEYQISFRHGTSIRGTLVDLHPGGKFGDYWMVSVPGEPGPRPLSVSYVRDRGVTIFVRSNGVVTEPEMPKFGEVWEWVTPPPDYPTPRMVGIRFTICSSGYRYNSTGSIGSCSMATVAKYARKVCVAGPPEPSIDDLVPLNSKWEWTSGYLKSPDDGFNRFTITERGYTYEGDTARGCESKSYILKHAKRIS